MRGKFSLTTLNCEEEGRVRIIYLLFSSWEQRRPEFLLQQRHESVRRERLCLGLMFNSIFFFLLLLPLVLDIQTFLPSLKKHKKIKHQAMFVLSFPISRSPLSVANRPFRVLRPEQSPCGLDPRIDTRSSSFDKACDELETARQRQQFKTRLFI